MSRSITLRVRHDLGVALAKRRVSDRFEVLEASTMSKFGTASLDWVGDVGHVDATAIGQKAKATVTVAETEITIAIELPWLLAGMAGMIESILKGNADALRREPKIA